MKIKIPIWPYRRLVMEVRLVKMIRLSEQQAKGYIKTSCEQAGYEIETYGTPAELDEVLKHESERHLDEAFRRLEQKVIYGDHEAKNERS